MPDETPVEVQPTASPEAVQQTPENVLPDTPPDESADRLKTIEAEKTALAEKLSAAEKAKEELSARLRDNQEYISRTRKVEQSKADVPIPKRSFDEYVAERLKQFEEDPKEGFKRFITDVAYDRDLEKQEYDKRISEAETSAFKRVLKLDPEKAKIMQAVEKLEQDRPDLAMLNFDQKLEWVRMQDGASKPPVVSRAQLDRETDLTSDVGGGRGGKPDRMPAWANAPEVARENAGHFKSKQEMIDWANVTTAEDAKRLMAKKRAV